MKVVAVLHSPSMQDIPEYRQEEYFEYPGFKKYVKSVPNVYQSPVPQRSSSFISIHLVVSALKEKGPYTALYSAHFEETKKAAVFFGRKLRVMPETKKGLGYKNQPDDKVQEDAVNALLEISKNHASDDTVLLVSAPSRIRAIIYHCRSVEESERAACGREPDIWHDPAYIANFVVSGEDIKLINPILQTS